MKYWPKILFIVLFVLIANGILYGQYIGKRWAVIQDLEDRTVYLDTTTIRPLDNQLTVWSLIVYREPQSIEPLSKKVSHVKSQYLINSITKRYSIVGALYYDDKGRIIGESSSPKTVGGRDNYSTPLSENTSLEILVMKAQNYLTTGRLNTIPGETITSPDKVEFNSSLFDEVNSKLNAENNTDTTSTENTEEVTDPALATDEQINTMSQSAQQPLKPNLTGDIVVIKDAAETPNDEKDDEAPVNDVEAYQPPLQPENDKDNFTTTPSAQYDFENESNVTNVIFTDGNLFCFQVSSWRDKSVAEREAEKLKARGHNAFVVEAYIPSKRGTWYRVRIGYFNSLQETRDYMNRM